MQYDVWQDKETFLFIIKDLINFYIYQNSKFNKPGLAY